MGRDKYREYSAANPEKAFSDIKKGTSIRNAAKMYHVTYSTLYEKVSGKSCLGVKSGYKPVFSEKEEKRMSNWLIALSRQLLLWIIDLQIIGMMLSFVEILKLQKKLIEI